MAHLIFDTHSANDPGGASSRLCLVVAEENAPGHVFCRKMLKKLLKYLFGLQSSSSQTSFNMHSFGSNSMFSLFFFALLLFAYCATVV